MPTNMSENASTIDAYPIQVRVLRRTLSGIKFSLMFHQAVVMRPAIIP
jgi:hypothetical protein